MLAGGADYPVALLGSGVCRPGMVSEVAGTCHRDADRGAARARPGDQERWDLRGALGGLRAAGVGGDAARWARRAFHGNELSYEEILALAEAAPVGAEALFFLPYLAGERLGAHSNSRARSSSGSSPATVCLICIGRCWKAWRSRAHRHLRQMGAATGTRAVVLASGGGRRPLWLRIKAASTGGPS